MKTPAEVRRNIQRRLERTWSKALVDEQSAPRDEAWPHRFALSTESSREIEAGFAAVVGQVDDWRAWAREFDVELMERARRIGVVAHTIPSHVIVSDVDVAAQICGDGWPERLQRGRRRLAELRQRFPRLADPARMLATVDQMGDVDFELLLHAGHWFTDRSAAGLTPRQVPLEGFHAKWLNTRQRLVATLAGTETLDLAPNHPARIHFTYLDPGHLDRGGRHHDSATVGDRFQPAYEPRIVIISENKDTAVNFPQLERAISIEGVGKGGSTIAAFDWITQAPTVIYWGDMDADGLEILSGFREAGVTAAPILMDRASFERWERFGTDVDRTGAVLTVREPKAGLDLPPAEMALYRDLVSPAWSRVRRIEQERIPLEIAREAVLGASLGATPPAL